MRLVLPGSVAGLGVAAALLFAEVCNADQGGVADPAEARGVLDIRYAAHGHAGETSVTQRVTTYVAFASKLLRNERSIAFALYKRYYSYPELWVFVIWRRGALRAVIRDNDGNVVGYVPVSRPSRSSVKVVVPKALLGDPPSYRWAAFTTDHSGTDATLERGLYPSTGVILIRTVLHDYTAPAIQPISVPDPTTNASAGLDYPVTFAVHDQGAAGIRRWRLERRIPGGFWSTVASGGRAGSKEIRLWGVEATSYEHRVIATDWKGNRASSATATASVPLDDSNSALAASFAGSWTASTSSGGAFLGTLHSTSDAEAAFSYSFSGSHIAWIAPASNGTADVAIDGGVPEPVNLSAFNGARQVVFADDLPAGIHTFALTVTSGTVAVDAIVVHGVRAALAARSVFSAEDIDGLVLPPAAEPLSPRRLSEGSRYFDSWRGWPVAPLHRQHPIRGSFLDPRPGGFHFGIDINVRDDRPEAGAPRGRTHRVYAMESGAVLEVVDGASVRCGHRQLVEGHFDYRHVDAVVSQGQFVRAGQMIGWTCLGLWHVHLTETAALGGGPTINPLRPGGKLAPFNDSAAPAIHSIRFFRPAGVIWLLPGAAMWSPVTGDELAPDRLSGLVDARAWIGDPQSFRGWFDTLPSFYADHMPTRVRVSVIRPSDARILLSRTVLDGRVFPYGVPFNSLFAMGTSQNLSGKVCYRMRHVVNPARACEGRYLLHLFAAPYWDTRLLRNGNYRLRVRAWDAVGNASTKTFAVTIAN